MHFKRIASSTIVSTLNIVREAIKKKVSQSWDIVPTGGWGGDVPTFLFGYFFGRAKTFFCEEKFKSLNQKNSDLSKSQKIVA
jgi:hypothetical protein